MLLIINLNLNLIIIIAIFLATSERVLQKATTTDSSAAASTAAQQENRRGLYFFCDLFSFSTGLTGLALKFAYSSSGKSSHQ